MHKNIPPHAFFYSLAAASQRVEMDDANNNRSDASASHLIAVVDDDPSIRKIMGYLLPGAGYRVVMWTRATGAAAMIEQEQPALVVLDIKMEHERAGLDVLRAVRRQLATTGIPVLFVSAWVDSLAADERDEILASRADTMLKPFDFRDLLGKISEMIASRN